MRRFTAIALACAAVACALWAPTAGASVREIGLPKDFPFPPADCPQDCQALAQVTGFQVQLGKHHNPFRLTKSGWIVAFTVRLAQPTADQISFFKTSYGAHPTARVAIDRLEAGCGRLAVRLGIDATNLAGLVAPRIDWVAWTR